MLETIITVINEQMVAIDKIAAPLDLMMRVKLDRDTVAAYAEAMQQGSTFPPLDCAMVNEELFLTDGFHRYKAYLRRHVAEVKVRIREAESYDDAVLWAVQANAHQGLKRSNADKQKSVEALLATDKYRDMPAEDVSTAAGVHQTTVLRHRAKLAKINCNAVYKSPKTRVDKAGRKRPTTYKKRKKQKREPTPRLPPDPPMQWPTREETGAPPPELGNEPHPDHPGLTYSQVFIREHGFVQVMPLAAKQKQQNEMAVRDIIGRVRDVGAACKELMTKAHAIPLATFIETFNALEAAVWSRKLNQHRDDIEAALPFLRMLMDATRSQPHDPA